MSKLLECQKETINNLPESKGRRQVSNFLILHSKYHIPTNDLKLFINQEQPRRYVCMSWLLTTSPFWTALAAPSCFRQQFLLVQLCTNSCSFQRLTVERTLCSNVIDSNVLFQCIFTTNNKNGKLFMVHAYPEMRGQRELLRFVHSRILPDNSHRK